MNNQAKNDRNNAVLKKERDKRDAAITAWIKSGVELNRKKLFDDISEAFKKQELRLDTLKKDVERIRDAARKV